MVYREVFIEQIGATELDLYFPFYNVDTDEKNDIVYCNEDHWGDCPSIDIDQVIGILEELKRKGSNRVYLAEHCDHFGYYFTGVRFDLIQS